jgi:hypothetical protein
MKKYKYFSKKHGNYGEPKHKPYNSGKTVEVFLFENGEKNKEQETKKSGEKTPVNKSVEIMGKGQGKIGLPVYHKYISQVKKVSTSSKLKDLHKKMHS